MMKRKLNSNFNKIISEKYNKVLEMVLYNYKLDNLSYVKNDLLYVLFHKILEVDPVAKSRGQFSMRQYIKYFYPDLMPFYDIQFAIEFNVFNITESIFHEINKIYKKLNKN